MAATGSTPVATFDLQDPSFFPALAHASSSASPAKPRLVDRLWSNIIAEPAPTAPQIPVSLMETPEEIIPFDQDFTEAAAVEWSLCLVGYSIGKRPYYEALNEIAKRIWKLKGTFKLIALTDGFFLFKFSLLEDYDMVWSKGAWFFHGKPFIFKKWTKNFNPTRENFTSVPIWVRVHNLPLICWNTEGISKIASKIGIPIAVDALTAAKTRLTYARICIQVSTTSSFPDTVSVAIEGDVIKLQVQYEWKPIPCASCGSLAHSSAQCPANPQAGKNVNLPPRGRSTSRIPRRISQARHSSSHHSKGKEVVSNSVIQPPSIPNIAASSNNLVLVPSQITWVPKEQNVVDKNGKSEIGGTSKEGTIPSSASKSPVKTFSPPRIPVASEVINIPDLNYPTEEGIGETVIGQISTSNPPIVKMSNKFSSLQGTEEHVLLGSKNESSSFSESLSNLSGGNKPKSSNPKLKGKGSKKPPASSSKRK
ncbi:hypothetical protein KFK09_017763 [Dendrobium nobile]|uniref:DUF4283 domain-containing protein n=1 Tax=Dendrobium nobile TaxID=94219 RepID=A0A8T3ATX4_DENNO|nr:hypothetical protein KFK09_017763 [Dendrobium nobile]